MSGWETLNAAQVLGQAIAAARRWFRRRSDVELIIRTDRTRMDLDFDRGTVFLPFRLTCRSHRQEPFYAYRVRVVARQVRPWWYRRVGCFNTTEAALVVLHRLAWPGGYFNPTAEPLDIIRVDTSNPVEEYDVEAQGVVHSPTPRDVEFVLSLDVIGRRTRMEKRITRLRHPSLPLKRLR